MSIKPSINSSDFLGMITDAAALRRVCESFAKSQYIAIDTEYISEYTYYPRLSLVQISDGTTHALLDILASQDLKPLQKLLAQPKTTKIIHALEPEMGVLGCIACPIRNPVFDTQLAAAFLGFGYQISYQALVKSCLGTELKKEYTRSDWLARPLSKAQINYAFEDVVYLHELCRLLSERLQKSQKMAWFEEESQRVLETYSDDGSIRANLRVVSKGKLNSAYERDCLKKLAAWREEEAKQANLPRRWLVKDADLIALVKHRITPGALQRKCHESHGHTIDIGELQQCLNSTKREGQAFASLSQEDKILIRKIKLLVAQIAKDHTIERSLIASHKQISQFVRDKKNRANSILSYGWRYQIMKQQIEQLTAIADN